MTFTTTKIIVVASAVLGSGLGLYSCHAAAIRNAKQLQEAQTRSEVVTEINTQRAVERQQYENRILDLQAQYAELAKTRAASRQQVEIITREATEQREQVNNLDSNAVRAAIRQRLSRASPAASP